MTDKKITEWRNEIDKINSKILDLLNKRMDFVKKIGKRKKELGIPIVDAGREKQIYDNLDKLADEKEIEREFVREIFKKIIDKSVREEKLQWQKVLLNMEILKK